MNAKAYMNVYLYLMRDGKILLSKRENTGYEDTMWSLVAGHAEWGETAAKAMIREAKEEIDIDIKKEDLRVVHVLHRRSDRDNMDIFLHCDTWTGDLKNVEPHKCGGVAFFAMNELPGNTIGYIKEILVHIQNGFGYAEWGYSDD
jgi:ADP-ribose pyrophosphatase YjhB (NUDIX family)